MDTATQLITEHLDTWTASVQVKSSAGRGSGSKRELYGIKKLRELILELAVRGMLVPQDPSDEPASELVKRIQAEKAALIKQGKIRKSKLPGFPTKAEEPFELPDGWAWAPIGVIGNVFNGNSISARVKEEKYTNVEGLPFIATKDVGYGFDALDYNNGISIPDGEDKFKTACKGSVLICAEGGSAGKKCGITDRDICFGNKLFANELHGGIEPVFVLSVYLSPSFFARFSEAMTGIIGGISSSKFIQLQCPLPPLAEQNRIVAKVDELMALCDRLEQAQGDNLETHETLVATLLDALIASASDATAFQAAWQRIAEHFDALFTTEASIDQLKQSILQLAVMGKLVPQDPKDEPASELLKKIAAEKAKLVKEGKIKKQKKLPEITEEEAPFMLPAESWSWVKLDDITQLITKGSSPKWQGISYVTKEEGILFVTSENVGYYSLRKLDEPKYVESRFNEIEPRSILSRGDILMNLVGASIGRTALYTLDEEANINQAVALIRLVGKIDGVDRNYLLHYLNSPEAIDYMLGSRVINAQPNISLTDARNFLIPLPPLAEQHRIVAKVDELMALCEALKAKLQDAQATQLQLTDSLVEQAVG